MLSTMDSITIVTDAADICAREHLAQYGEATDIPESWTGDMYDADLNYAADQIGRPLTDEESSAFDRAFRSTFDRLAAAYQGRA